MRDRNEQMIKPTMRHGGRQVPAECVQRKSELAGPPPPAAYVMGYNDRERRRLALQATILNPFTEQLLRRAGISTGMHVLDLGCGIGDVSLMAARLVGRHGTVTAIDIDPKALAIAADRARE
jgi:SAM-dependent methyltransferase